MLSHYFGVDAIERYLKELQQQCAANINQAGMQPNDPFEGDPAAKALHDQLAAEEAETAVCPLCRDTVPRSKPQCTSVAFCNSMPVRRAPL